MTKGDIVLITFPFTDLSGSKLRPAIVLAVNKLDITVCFITTQVTFLEQTDVEITPSQKNGIKQPSLIRTSKIATLDKSLAKGLIGELTNSEIKLLDNNLKVLFQIS
jgi:mRNA interferase MazF